jgi:hypothetical protein
MAILHGPDVLSDHLKLCQSSAKVRTVTPKRAELSGFWGVFFSSYLRGVSHRDRQPPCRFSKFRVVEAGESKPQPSFRRIGRRGKRIRRQILDVLLTGLQSLPPDQVEAAKLDGANARQIFFHITLPHLTRLMQIIVVIETIFIIQVFGEIYTATGGGPGLSTSNIPYLLYAKAFFEYDIGLASASAVVAVIVVNIVSIGVLRLVGHGR